MNWLRRLVNTVAPRGASSATSIARWQFHLAERIDELRAQGLTPRTQASRRARLQFGNLSLQADRTRDMDVSLWTDTLLRDTKYASEIAAADARIHTRRHPHPRARHRRQRRGVFGDQCRGDCSHCRFRMPIA